MLELLFVSRRTYLVWHILPYDSVVGACEHLPFVLLHQKPWVASISEDEQGHWIIGSLREMEAVLI